jgi:hypothetical protein
MLSGLFAQSYLDRLSQWLGRKPHTAKVTPGRA